MQQQQSYYQPQHGPNNGGNPGGPPRGPTHRQHHPQNSMGANGMGPQAHTALRMPTSLNQMSMSQVPPGAVPYPMFQQTSRPVQPVLPFVVPNAINGMGHNQRMMQPEQHYGPEMAQYVFAHQMFPSQQPQYPIPPPTHSGNPMHSQSRPQAPNQGVPMGVPSHSSAAPASIAMHHHVGSAAMVNAPLGGGGVAVSQAGGMAGPHNPASNPGGGHQLQPSQPQQSMHLVGGPTPSASLPVEAPPPREKKILTFFNPDTGKPVDFNDSTPSDKDEKSGATPAVSSDKTDSDSSNAESQARKPAIISPSNPPEPVPTSRPIAITAPPKEESFVPEVEKSGAGSQQPPKIHSEPTPKPSGGVPTSSSKPSSDLTGLESKTSKPDVPSVTTSNTTPKSAPKETLSDTPISPTSEGNKASKTKKKGPARKAELNRKGDQKDGGSDMDAFKDLEKDNGGKPVAVAEPAPVSTAVPPTAFATTTAPATTTPPLSTTTTTTASTSSPASTAPLPSTNALKVEAEEAKIPPVMTPSSQPLPSAKVALTDNNNVSVAKHSNSIPEVVTSEPERETKVSPSSVMMPPPSTNVTATSRRTQDDSDLPSTTEENASSNSLDPAITNMLPKTSSSLSKLKYEYKPGQWSPLNPSGSKQYDREFLMKLQNDPLSKQKPQKLPDMDIVKDTSNITGRKIAPSTDWTPGYVQGTSSRGHMGGISKKGSQNGGKRPDAGKKIISGLSIQEKVVLHETENAWKPEKLRANKPDADKPAPDSMEALSKKARGILNKLTPQKFDTLVEKFNSLPIDTEEKLNLCMELVFEKAVDEPGFSVAYARMCEVLGRKEVLSAITNKPVAFKSLLLIRCQKEFHTDYMDKTEKEKFQKEYEAADSEEKRKELKAEFEEKELKARRRSLGNIRFIGELYKLEMVRFKIMHECICNLLGNENDEESLECLCRLLSTVGKTLDDETTKTLKLQGPSQGVKDFDIYFTRIRKIIQNKQISSRVRFMLQDLVDLRQRKWKPRREAVGPKTIDEIHKDAEREKRLETLMSKNSGGGGRDWSGRDGRDSNRDGGRAPFTHNDSSRKKTSGASAQSQGSDEGWSTSRTKFKPDTFNVDLVKNVKKVDTTTLQLGGPSRVGSSWSQGSRAPRSSAKGMLSPSVNRFAAIASFSSSESGTQRDEGGSSRSGMNPESRFGPRDSSPASSNSFEKPEAVTNSAQAKRNGPPTASNALDARAANQLQILKGEPNIDVDKTVKLIVDEYLSTNDMKEALRDISEKFHPNTISDCVSCVVEYALERSDGTRNRIGLLFDELVKQNYLLESQFLKGWCFVLDAVPDLIVDIPKVWDYLGSILAPLMKNGTLSLSFLLDSVNFSKEAWKEAPSNSNFPGLYAAAVLHALAVNEGHKFVGGMWRKTGLQWSQFVPEADVDNFIETHKLDFSVNDLTVSANGPIKQLSDEQKKTELLKRLQNQDPKHNDVIFDWIDATWGSQVTGNDFIRLLTTSVIESSLLSDEPLKLDDNKLGKLGPVLKRFLDGDLQKEKQVLFALQHLMDKWEHPRQMLKALFEKFYDQSVLSLDAFMSWKNDEDVNEQAGKGVAIKSTTGFFTWLKENDDDDEDDDDEEDEEDDEVGAATKNKP